jgi:outer membrane protein assembly factor BamB
MDWKKQRILMGAMVGVWTGLVTVQAMEQEVWQRNWGQWRGPAANGVATHADPPTTWSETENVKWKVEIPGTGHSTPIVWEDRIFLLTAVPTGTSSEPPAAASGQGADNRRGRGQSGPLAEQEFRVLCLNRADGAVRWQRPVLATMPHAGHHGDNSYASASPVTDGSRVYSYFGSYGLYCHDMDGNPVWSRQFPPMQSRNGFGEGASPALHGDTLVLVRDQEGDSMIYALDAATGETRWEKPRDEASNWSTPLIVETEGRTEVVVNGTAAVISYDLATGDVLWHCSGQTANPIPSPVAGHGMIYAMSGFRGSALYAVKQGATGQIDGTDAVAWTLDRGTPYVPSPLLLGDNLYFVQGNDSRLSRVNAKDGTVHYAQERLEGLRGGYPSAVAAAGRIYLVDRDGNSLVLNDGPTITVAAANTLDDRFTASPALVGTEMFLRGHRHLYCIANP